MFYKRYLTMDLPPHQSAFLWGARKTGKSTFLKTKFPHMPYYDFLQSDVFFRFSKEPHLFREEILMLEKDEKHLLIIVDEVQKIPALLDEIHWLIENTTCQFILCGSSARKLKRYDVNMLGGRAWKYHFFPLVYPEITDFDLLRVFNNGTLPSHYHTQNRKKTMRSYIEDYLTQEIQAEGYVRNLPAFARFIDVLRFSHGEMLNYTNIARECGVNKNTVKEYFQILVDTLLGYFILPYHKKAKRQLITSIPKFYLFDVGVANYIKQQNLVDLKGEAAGRSLEHYVLTELMAYKYLNDYDFDIRYWRTKTGIEVDFVLGDAEIAIEVKISSNIQNQNLKPLRAFMEEYHPKACYIVCSVPKARLIRTEEGDIHLLPLEQFLQNLWSGKIIK